MRKLIQFVYIGKDRRSWKLAKKKSSDTITIDDKEYSLENLSRAAREQLENIKFVDARLLQLNNELAVSDTARIGYTNALKSELK